MSFKSVKHLEMHQSDTINICDNNLVEFVICNKPSSDGYDVQNLISNKLVEKSKGFLVERFISAPVTLNFEFKTSVYIKYIVIYCKVGAQKTSGIEIFSQGKTDIEYVSLGSGVLNDSKSGFVFHRYNEVVDNKYCDQYLLRTFKPKSSLHLSAVKRIQIRIFRTCRNSIPALGKVEFWGIPHNLQYVKKLKERVCRSEELRHIEECQVLTPAIRKPCTSIKEPCNLPKELNPPQSISIPEEFLDPITFEVMSLPVIMPSGKIIDIKTLESYEKEEKCWGRGPNDPFTGVMFSDSSKPIAASHLKARIDRYLSINSNCTELFNIPRTVGRFISNMPLQTPNKASVSKLIMDSTSKSNIDCGLTTVNNEEIEVKAKRRKLVSMPAENLTDIVKYSKMSNTSICDVEKNDRYSSFDERVEKSFEQSLKLTLSQLPNLTADKQKIGENIINCSVCKTLNNLFSIPCNHYICRMCLVTNSHKSIMICILCNYNYSKSDLNKIHLL